jgi:hypothetical protein
MNSPPTQRRSAQDVLLNLFTEIRLAFVTHLLRKHKVSVAQGLGYNMLEG